MKCAAAPSICRTKGVPSMPKRETALNIFLGAIVILRWIAPVVGFLLVLYGVGIALEHYWPAKFHDASYAVTLIFVFTTTCYTSARNRRWLTAFLSLLAIALPLSSWGHGTRHADSPGFMAETFLIVFFFATARRSLRAWECVLLAALIASGVALNLGLLGAGTVLRVIAEALPFGTLIWMVVLWRCGDLESAPENSSV
jgi:hypothetical protein